jgi:hypothetical protein
LTERDGGVYGTCRVKPLAIPFLVLALGTAIPDPTFAHPDTLGVPDPYWQQFPGPASERRWQHFPGAPTDADAQASGDANAPGRPRTIGLFQVFVYVAAGPFALLVIALLHTFWNGRRRSHS